MAQTNQSLSSARKNKIDEFYTLLEDVKLGVMPFADQFKNKTVICNCNDQGRAFHNFFEAKKNTIGLKSLIITDGDFRSKENIELLKQADIVCTNPPFSLFREYFDLLMRYDKQFLIIGNINAVSCKNIFPHMMAGKARINPFRTSGGWEFLLSKSLKLTAKHYRTDINNQHYVKLGGIRWFTTFNIPPKPLTLTASYDPAKYPRYDNYDAINVDKVKDIPMDYYGVMGVPITFLDVYNPEQFEILGLTKTPVGLKFRTKLYSKQIQHSMRDGIEVCSNVINLNDSPVLLCNGKPEKFPYYEIGSQYYIALYSRILIRRVEGT